MIALSVYPFWLNELTSERHVAEAAERAVFSADALLAELRKPPAVG